jgi:hypothetical protein
MHSEWASRITASKVAAIAILFLSTRIFLLELYQPPGTDITVYHGYVTRAANGEMPYRDIAIEYPPLAWPVMTLPASTDWAVYRRRFRYSMFAMETAAGALFAAVLRRRGQGLMTPGVVAYLAATMALGPVLYDRLDAGLLFLLMLWAYAWQRGLAGRSSWIVLAYLVLGLSVAFKLTPIVAIPVLLVTELTRERSAARTATRVGALAAGIVLPFVPHLATAGTSTLSFLQYHGARGLEVESFFANIVWALSLVGLPIAIDYRFTSFEVTSALSSWLALASTLSLIVLPLALAGRALALGRLYDERTAYKFAGLLLPAMLPFGKVLSPQYFVWAIPMMLLVGAELVVSRRGFWVLCAVMVGLAILTTGVYPIGFGALRALRPDAWLLLTARNVLLAGVVAWLTYRVLSQS